MRQRPVQPLGAERLLDGDDEAFPDRLVIGLEVQPEEGLQELLPVALGDTAAPQHLLDPVVARQTALDRPGHLVAGPRADQAHDPLEPGEDALLVGGRREAEARSPLHGGTERLRVVRIDAQGQLLGDLAHPLRVDHGARCEARDQRADVGLQPRHGVVEPAVGRFGQGQDERDLGEVQVVPGEVVGDVHHEVVRFLARCGRDPEVVLPDQLPRELADHLPGLEPGEAGAGGPQELAGVAAEQLLQHRSQRVGQALHPEHRRHVGVVAELAELLAGEVDHGVGGGPGHGLHQRSQRQHGGVDPGLAGPGHHRPAVDRARQRRGVQPVLGQGEGFAHPAALLVGGRAVAVGGQLQRDAPRQLPVDRAGGRGRWLEAEPRHRAAQHRLQLLLRLLQRPGPPELLQHGAQLRWQVREGVVATVVGVFGMLAHGGPHWDRCLATVLATAPTRRRDEGGERR